jgi:predicted N-acyltransferase
MPPLRVTVAGTLTAVAPEAWAALAAARTPFHELAWFRSAPAPGGLRLLVARRGERVHGVLPLYLVTEPAHYYHSPREILCGVRERALCRSVGYSTDPLEQAARARWFPCAIVASPYGYRGGIMVDPGDPAAAEVATALVRAADACCRRERVRGLLYYGLLAAEDGVLLDALRDEQIPSFIVGAHCDLPMRWATLDAYFATLRARGRRLRSRYRQAQRDPDTRWRILSPDGGEFGGPLREAAVELFGQTARRHGDAEPPRDLYRALLGEWPLPRHLLVGESANGRLRSALLVLEHGSTLYPKYFGSAVRGDYFHLTFPKTIELAIRRGATRIAYGGGSHEAKLLRGAELVTLLGAFVAYDRTLNAAWQEALPAYRDAKREYFGELAARRGAPPSFFGATASGVRS